ncbi:precorrin-6Y C5,15-methyltransferase (decarboxylating) subunit CbiT [Clostridium peptidivorans]|uniref:precorrin-6Y C5,15-methyltransferase (decarboxylating) subunit CbiT n=1 Tax=Clostridium peptidivorans TaxID=100174 RepID=UPI000BE479B1|nr:precorrin-6Y C5,15-methyltransferase (decarboxylating) subunit CbiT [Clostridium peptidivorans]
MIVEREEVGIKDKELHFIKDEELIRGNCPMTKEEIRILSIAKLNLREDSYVLDVGAGTGSISVQAAKFCPLGKVVAIEKDEDAIDTIKKNVNKFKLNNLELVEGEAMEVINNIDCSFDSIFIGGSGGNIEDIIKDYGKKLLPGGKMILNFITINNLYKAMDTLKKLGYKVSCTQVSISKTKGESYMLFGNNPIFIIEGEK